MGGIDVVKVIDMYEGIFFIIIGLFVRYIYFSVVIVDLFDLVEVRKMLFIFISDLFSDKIKLFY